MLLRPVRSTSKCVVSCAMVKNLESNHDMWVRIIEDETEQNNDTDTTDANVPSSSVTVYFIYIIFLRDAMHSADYAVAR